MDSMEFQVTGERSPGEHTSLQFEIATHASDGSGFSGEKVLMVFWPNKEYFTSFSMTQPGRGGRGAKGLFHLRIQIDQWQEWQSQTQEKCDHLVTSPQLPGVP